MNKLKKINDRFYQECEVIMLATDKITGIIKFGNQLRTTPQGLSNMVYYSQHLYFLSNEEIEEGDWFMNRQYMIEEDKEECAIWRCGDITPNSNPKKIIATTDNYLQIHDKTPIGENVNGLWKCLPQPSKQFIQAYVKSYNEGEPITKVLVEMGKTGFIINRQFPASVSPRIKLKVNSSNEITIKKIKDSYTREEVEKLT